MIYKEIIGDIKCVYEGTAEEIAELCNRINTKPVTECKYEGSILNPIDAAKSVINQPLKPFSYIYSDNDPEFIALEKGENITTPSVNVPPIKIEISKYVDIDKVAEQIYNNLRNSLNHNPFGAYVVR